MLVAALGVASIFAVYTFIGPFVTDVAAFGRVWIPVALALFGLGMTTGNLIGGRIADTHAARGLVVGFGCALVVLALLAAGGGRVWVLMPALFGVGATMMIAIPTIQVRLTRLAPEAPTLMGAMNLAALNVANAVGAWAGRADHRRRLRPAIRRLGRLWTDAGGTSGLRAHPAEGAAARAPHDIPDPLEDPMTIQSTLLNGKLGFGTAPLGNMFRNIPEEEAAATVAAAWEKGGALLRHRAVLRRRPGRDPARQGTGEASARRLRAQHQGRPDHPSMRS